MVVREMQLVKVEGNKTSASVASPAEKYSAGRPQAGLPLLSAQRVVKGKNVIGPTMVPPGPTDVSWNCCTK